MKLLRNIFFSFPSYFAQKKILTFKSFSENCSAPFAFKMKKVKFIWFKFALIKFWFKVIRWKHICARLDWRCATTAFQGNGKLEYYCRPLLLNFESKFLTKISQLRSHANSLNKRFCNKTFLKSTEQKNGPKIYILFFFLLIGDLKNVIT
jgi:hypothetical protein